MKLCICYLNSTLVVSMDMKCPLPSRCWYCKDLCENCLLPSGFGPGLTAQSITGISLKFCSQKCAQYFTGSEERPMSLDIEILPPRRQHDSKPSTPKAILQIAGSGLLRKDEGVKITCLICHGYHSEKCPNGRFFILCQLRSLFSQRVVDKFVSDKAVPEESLPHADCVTSSKDSGTITWIIISALQTIQELIRSNCKEEVDLNLTMLTKFQNCLFNDDKEFTNSIKVSEYSMCLC